MNHPSNSSTLPRGASILAFREDGKILAVTRRNSTSLCLPGGKREPGEDALHNAVRETAEETGVLFSISSLTPFYSGVCETDSINDFKHFFIDTFATKWDHSLGYPAKTEPDIDVLWVTPDEFKDRMVFIEYNTILMNLWAKTSYNPSGLKSNFKI